jgi:Flp pilus assembly protein TadG
MRMALVVRRLAARLWRTTRDDRGEIIPTAILYPLAILAVFAVVQIAMIFQARDAAADAAQQAATAEAAYQATPGVGYGTATTALAPTSNLLITPQVSVDRTATDVRVTVSGNVVGWLGLRYHVTQVAYAPIERFTTDASS